MKSKKKPKIKHPYSVTLVFDDKDSAHGFTAHWLDGGGDGGGNLDWHTCFEESADWTDGVPAMMRIKGTGNPLDANGNPVDEEADFKKRMVKLLKESKKCERSRK